MPRIHPKRDSIEELVAGLGRTNRLLLQHALGCSACREALLDLLGESAERPASLGRVLTWRFTERSYGATVDVALRRLKSRLSSAERERAAAPELLQELLHQPAERRRGMVGEGDRYRSMGLADLLLRECREANLRQDPAAADLARLALAVVSRLDPAVYGKRLLEDLRARGWAFLANALRIASDLRAADEAFTAAEAHLARGTRDRLERAQLLQLKASLRRAQRRFAESEKLYVSSIALFLRAGERHQAGAAMVSRSTLTSRMGDDEAAFAQLREAADLIDPEADPRLNCYVRHNLIDYLQRLGRYGEAQALMAKSAHFYELFHEPHLLLRRQWISALIARGLGRPEEAAEILRQVCQGFVDLGDGYLSALASLDLAGVCLLLGCTAEVKRLTEEMVPIFLSRDVHREMLAAVKLFHQAATAEQATVAMADELAKILRQGPREALPPSDPKL